MGKTAYKAKKKRQGIAEHVYCAECVRDKQRILSTNRNMCPNKFGFLIVDKRALEPFDMGNQAFTCSQWGKDQPEITPETLFLLYNSRNDKRRENKNAYL